jgi:hypothetical protein
LVQDEARLASVMAFLRLICFHLLWPAIAEFLQQQDGYIGAGLFLRHAET